MYEYSLISFFSLMSHGSLSSLMSHGSHALLQGQYKKASHFVIVCIAECEDNVAHNVKVMLWCVWYLFYFWLEMMQKISQVR